MENYPTGEVLPQETIEELRAILIGKKLAKVAIDTESDDGDTIVRGWD